LSFILTRIMLGLLSPARGLGYEMLFLRHGV